MSALQEEIVNLKSKIEIYENDHLSKATTEARKDKLLDVITETRKTLNALLTQQQQQQQQQGGKFHIQLYIVCVLECGCGWMSIFLL